LGASNQSRYSATGTDFFASNPSPSGIGNTLTGWRNGVEFRSYFVFDVGAVSSTVTGARLRLLNKRYYSTENSEEIELFDVTTPTAELIGGVGRTDIFQDLGTGNAYGSATLVATPPTNDFDNVVEEYFEVVLTQAAIAGINQAASQGQQYFSIGIRLSDQNESPYQFIDPRLNGLTVEGTVFSGGLLDPLQNSEVPGELLLDIKDPNTPVGIPEPSAVLSLVALGLTGSFLSFRARRSQ
jgi:hypothetical protein